jgi:sortase B
MMAFLKTCAKKFGVFVRILKMVFGVCFLLMCAGAFSLMYVEHCEDEKQTALVEIHNQGSAVSSADSVAAPGCADGSSDADAAVDTAGKSYDELAGINGDYLGWLTVEGSGVDLPVVLAADNSYYLNHDFYGKKSSYGTLFADCLTKRDAGGNVLIYGHHMKNGSMFGSLTSYCDREFFENNRLILWETEDGASCYEIFAALVVPGEEADPAYLPVRSYLGQIPSADQENLLGELKARALRWRNLPVSGDNDLLFLMTCDYTKKDGRLLLCAVRVE